MRWSDLHGGDQVKIQHSRSTVVGQGVLESDTKNHRTRIVVMPQIVFDDLGELFTQQALKNNGADWNGFPDGNMAVALARFFCYTEVGGVCYGVLQRTRPDFCHG